MFKLAIAIGIYSYIIFVLGITSLLTKTNVVLTTIAFITFIIIYFLKTEKLKSFDIKIKNFSLLSKFILLLILTQIFVNFIGVLGPEISFDALWYHLTLPKLYLLSKSIFHIPGGLLYYSDMPKLVEMIYVGALSFGNEILAKFIHFIFGLLSLAVIYKLARRFLSIEYSLIATLIFYSNLVVGWLSISSYVDLARTFFEILSFFALLLFIEKNDKKYLLTSAIILGLAITTKLASVFSLSLFLVLLIYKFKVGRESFKTLFLNIFSFTLIALIIPLPWFIFSYLNTGNPIYPYLSLPVDSGSFINLPNLFLLPKDLFLIFLGANDPISPIYLIFIPLILIFLKKSNTTYKYLFIYVIFSFLIWYLTQSFRGTRFLLPYLAVFSILCAFVISKIKNSRFKNYLIFLVIFISIISIIYRGVANAKYLPVIFDSEYKKEFLSKNLNFSYGDFYDIDDYFKNNIKNTDKVLLYGFHNLYYVDFPFIDSSWVKKGNKFNYIATQNVYLPKRFSNWKIIYYNKTTNVKLYTLDKKLWEY